MDINPTRMIFAGMLLFHATYSSATGNATNTFVNKIVAKEVKEERVLIEDIRVVLIIGDKIIDNINDFINNR